MSVKGSSRWRLRLGIASAVLTAVLAVLMTSALPVVLDLRPALAVLAAATALLLAGAGAGAAGRAGRGLLIGLAALAGLASLWAARDLWLDRPVEVRFAGENGVELAGTLYLPRSGGRHAAIVLVHGAGPGPRKEYGYYARRYARAGLIALAYDKRGSGASGGDFRAATYESLAADVVAAVEMLRGRPDADARRVGLWGVSEGEWVATLAAVQCKPAFLVVVSPSAMTPSEQVRYETRSNVLRAGFGAAAADRAGELYGRLAQFQRTGDGRAELNRLLASARSEPWFAAARYLEESVPEYRKVQALTWFPAWRARMDFDPLPLFGRLECPVLAQVGGADPKNDGQAALDRLRKAMARGGNPHFTGILYPTAGHNVVVWRLPGDLPPPWFASGYLQDQLAWVLRHDGGETGQR